VLTAWRVTLSPEPRLVDDALESTVRQWLRNHQGGAYCATCIARELAHEDVRLVRAALDDLAGRQIFSVGPCACGATGLRYGW
jgi:hypothetical protein